MMKWLVALVAFVGIGCGTTTTDRLRLGQLETARTVDLSRYAGVWYEVASFPKSFQRGCVASTATYTPREDGTIEVLNRCRDGALDGDERSVRGTARVVDPRESAKLEVSFFWPFWADYWIVEVADDYSYAAVGHPSRDSLWILSRTPVMPSDSYDRLIAALRAKGYETERLVRTPH